jgi:hypothetical protein
LDLLAELVSAVERSRAKDADEPAAEVRPDVEIRRDLPERGHVDPVTDSHRNEPADSSPTDLAPDPSRESTRS